MMVRVCGKYATNLHWGKVAVWMLRWHAHGWVDWRWWSWAIWSACWTRVVLTATPTETNARVSDWVALHLVDGHFCRMTLDELNKATSLSWWDLDIGDFAKALEEGTELILGHIARETADKDGGVVWVSELVHWLGLAAVAIWHWWALHSVHAHWSTWHATTATTHWRTSALILILGSRGRDSHWAIAAVDTLHLGQSTLLVSLFGEAHKAVAAGKATDGVGHDLGRLA